MTSELIFRAWQRPPAARLADGVESGRTRAATTLTLSGTRADGTSAGSSATENVRFLLAGPADADGLQPGAILHRSPAPGSRTAETTMCPYVEFVDPAAPWLLAPAETVTPGSGLRPWLVLVVGTPEEVRVVDGEVQLSSEVLERYPLADSARWCHVQEADGTAHARLLSFGELRAEDDHVAALVPAYGAYDEDADPTGHGRPPDAWAPGDDGVVLDCYDHWAFRTGPEGDFRSLSGRLRAYGADPRSGVVGLDLPRSEGTPTLAARGALAPIGSRDEPAPARVVEGTAELLAGVGDQHEETDARGRPVIGLPRYGSAWRDDALDTRWGKALNHDPRHRGAAGLGVRIGRDEQQSLAEEAGRQAGALDAAAQRVANLGWGLTASGSLWDRRLPEHPENQITLLGPALRRVMTDEGSVAARATAPGRSLPSGWFSTAARRALRRGPARTDLASKEATDGRALGRAANRCPEPEPYASPGLPDIDPFLPGQLEKWLERLRKDPAFLGTSLLGTLDHLGKLPRLRELVEELRKLLDWAARERRPLPWTTLVLALVDAADVGSDAAAQARLERRLKELLEGFDQFGETDAELFAFLDGLTDPEPAAVACSPVDMSGLAAGVRMAFDPHREDASARGQVLDAIAGLDPEWPLAPPEYCPGLDVEVWRMLSERAGEWLLPGLGEAPDDAVLAVETNPTFTDAFLVGLNTQLLSELRWRNLRVASGCTPVRTFWNRIAATDDPEHPGVRLDDLLDIPSWGASTPLGASEHGPAEATGGDLVVVVRGQLLLRYPNTLVYLVPDRAVPQDGPLVVDPEDVEFPTFRGKLGDDAVYLGFQGVPAEELAAWWVVLEESPTGFRFDLEGAQDLSGTPHGGDAAYELFVDPVRVLLAGTGLHGGNA